jgi:hypothetical protein
MPKYEGACYCGSLRYAVTGDPLNTIICQCKSCQRQTGSAFSVVKPQVQLWCESAHSWVRLSEETRNFPKGMTA